MLALIRSLLNREYNLMNVLKALASIFSMCNLHVKDYTKIFYTIYKWNAPSIQCKKRVRRSLLVRKVDRLSLILNDLNIPAFTLVRH
jgi:hypothetical protein